MIYLIIVNNKYDIYLMYLMIFTYYLIIIIKYIILFNAEPSLFW